MSAAEIISEMADREQRDPEALWWPDASDLRRWVANDVEAVGSLCDEIAGLLAKGYERRQLSFGLCSGIVNGLYPAILELEVSWMPTLFYEVFLAFDAGEYTHCGDDPGLSPVTKYTDPAIRDIVQKLGG